MAQSRILAWFNATVIQQIDRQTVIAGKRICISYLGCAAFLERTPECCYYFFIDSRIIADIKETPSQWIITKQTTAWGYSPN